MPNPTLAGAVGVFGIDGTVVWTGVVSGVVKLAGVGLTDNIAKAELKNQKGRTIGKTAYNRQHDVSIRVIPSDDAGNLATAKSNVVIPPPLATVTISGHSIPALDGSYNYEGGSINVTQEGYLEMTLNLSRVADANGTMAALTPR